MCRRCPLHRRRRRPSQRMSSLFRVPRSMSPTCPNCSSLNNLFTEPEVQLGRRGHSSLARHHPLPVPRSDTVSVNCCAVMVVGSLALAVADPPPDTLIRVVCGDVALLNTFPLR